MPVVSEKYNLLVINPLLSKQWHPLKNGNLSPSLVTPGSGKKVWWRCKDGHVWQALIGNRHKGRGCPYCARQLVSNKNSLQYNHPELVKEWHPSKNGNLIPSKVSIGSDRKVWWVCDKDHEWKSSLYNRCKGGDGCPYCSGRYPTKENNLAVISPELAKEWHPIKNGHISPFDVTPKSMRESWWQCKKGHEWEQAPGRRYRKGKLCNCPFCLGRRLGQGNSLADMIPKLAKEWHPIKNGSLTPNDFSFSSTKKVWWQCEKGHVWEAAINYRKGGRKCPYCLGRRVGHDNNLVAINPELAMEWHPDKNGELTPYHVTPGCNRKVWWMCQKGHEWKVGVNNRSSGYGCPYCSGREADDTNNLAVLNPSLAGEWHPSKNGELSPFTVKTGSNKKVWWKCEKGHEWQRSIIDRSKGSVCPTCKSIEVKYPELIDKWHPTKNGKLTPSQITPGSERKVWWICAKNHEWQTAVNIRVGGSGCPVCANRMVVSENCLATTHPFIAKEWHPVKNQELTPQNVTAGSSRRIWWQCSKGHAWVSTIHVRTNRSHNCPYCSKKRASDDYNLMLASPELASEWHPTKNDRLTPEEVTPNSGKRVWWICKKGHEWQNVISKRYKGTGCQKCFSLNVQNPELAKEWHPKKNGNLTPKDVYAGSGKKAWWRCVVGHEWQATIASRNNGRDCPKCRPKSSRFELRLYCELLAIFKDTENRRRIRGLECDIYIPSLELGIDYDGWYWHRNRFKQDLEKFQKLNQNGFRFIKIRDEGLEPLSSDDIMYLEDDNEITVVKKVLVKISVTYQLDTELTKSIRRYLNRKTFHNNLYFNELIHLLPKPLPGKSLNDINPHLSKEWHPKKNGPITSGDVSPGSNLKIWWKCHKGHEWKATINSRNGGTGCPYCSGKRASSTYNLGIVNPQLAQEWHPVKNGELTPLAVTPNRRKKAWWMCNNDHEWRAAPYMRNQGIGCPYCYGRYATESDNLLVHNPTLAKEWHPTKNKGLTPTDVKPQSNKKVWWLCEKNHEWVAMIGNRYKGNGCPYCAGKFASVEYNLRMINPSLSEEWNRARNNELSPEDVTPNSHKKVWWKCSNGHEWQAIVSNRNKLGRGCPYCSGRRTTNKGQLSIFK